MEQHRDESESKGDPDGRAAAAGPVRGEATVAESAEMRTLAQALRQAASLAEVRGILREQARAFWPAHEIFVSVFDGRRNRFLFLLPDGSFAPKPGSSFGLNHFLTVPDRRHTFVEQVQADPQLLAELAAAAPPGGLLVRSLAVPIRQNAFLRGAIGIFGREAPDWQDADVERLNHLGRIFLETYELARRLDAQPQQLKTPPPIDTGALAKDWRRLRELLDFHETLQRIHFALLQPSEVLFAACRDLASFFEGFHFTIAVYFPESRLFVVHTPNEEPTRLASNETIEGYFLYRREEDVLAIEDYTIWSPPPPLGAAVRARCRPFHGGLLAAGRMHGSLVTVAGLQSTRPVAWDTREVELLRGVARGLGLVYYHAMLCDNLTYSCREAHRQLEETRNQARAWQRRVENTEHAAEVARALGRQGAEVEQVAELIRRLQQMWPDCRVSIQRYRHEQNGFESHPLPPAAAPVVRPARFCLESLFLNSIPVSHVICDSPQEIGYYQDLDPQLVEECSREGYRSFCTVPVFTGERLWGTITIRRREPGGCAPYVELLAEIGRAVTIPLAATEAKE